MDRRSHSWALTCQGNPDRLGAALRGHRVEGSRLPEEHLRPTADIRPHRLARGSAGPRRTLSHFARPPATGNDLRAGTPNLPAVAFNYWCAALRILG